MPLLNRPAHSKATLGDRSFYFASSSVWNSIPNDVRCAPSLSSFKSRLMTCLFCSVYKDRTVSLTTVQMCMVWPCHSFVDGLSYKCINVFVFFKVTLIIHDCLPILMLLYIMLAYLMLFAALSNAVCSYNALFSFFLLLIFASAFVIMLCLGLLTRCLFISSMIFHHFDLLVFLILCSHHFYMNGLCALWRKST